MTFDEECQWCRGTGLTSGHLPTRCSECTGRGRLLTAAGHEIVDLVKRWIRAGDDQLWLQEVYPWSGCPVAPPTSKP